MTSDFADQYKRLSDEQLTAIKIEDLVSKARIAYEAELRRRATPEYRQRERQRFEKIEKEAAATNWFSKPRSAVWKLGASVTWFLINFGVMLMLGVAGRGMGESQFLQFSTGMSRFFILFVGFGWYVIFSRPRAKSNQRSSTRAAGRLQTQPRSSADSSSSGNNFSNKGTTQTEEEVARLLNKKIPGGIVVGVRFARLSGQLKAYVDLAGGNALDGGFINESASAAQLANAIYQHVQTLTRL